MTSGIILPVLVCAAAFAQSGPSFEAADVHVSPRSNSFNMNLRGPFVRAGRFEMRTATMLDLIGTAYSMDSDRVYGGPNWLEMDRYDVIGKPPAGATRETEKRMLQQLLADRFHLVLHQDSKELPVYVMTVGKHPQMNHAAADGERQPGCEVQFRPPPSGSALPDGSAPPTPHYDITCKGVTMERFADDLRNNLPFTNQYLHNKPVADQTGLEGAWDFRFTLWPPPRAMGGSQNGGPATFFQLLEQQIGLKLEPGKATLLVLQVDKVDRKPSPNTPDIARLLAGSAAPTEFEVASIKPTDPGFQEVNFNIQSGGRVDIKGASLKFLIRQIWQIFGDDDAMAGAPKWLDDDRWDIVGKAPFLALSHGGPNTPGIDSDAVMVMLRNLLAERFKLATHMENRELSAYNLVAVNPKMKPADPSGRIKCFEGPGRDGKDPRDSNPVLGRLLTCQNMTMDRFADMLWGLAPVYIHSTVLNRTGLEGSWDFTLSFSFAGQLQNGGRGGDGGPPSGASDPNGAVSLPDAILKQLGLKLEPVKRPVPVLVIDHVEQKPIEN